MIENYLKLLIAVCVLIFTVWRLFFKEEEEDVLPFPEKWRLYLEEQVLFYRELSKVNKHMFEQRVLYFIEETSIIGVELELNDTDKLLVAASGIIPVFGFPEWNYDNLNEVLLYKNHFNLDYETEGPDRNVLGMVGSGEMNGIMILSRPALRSGFENQSSKTNVGIHEFVHLIDKSDGAIDGIPSVFLENPFVIPWLKRIHEEIKDINKRDSDINPYGSTNEAEFFSVASEYFFKVPHLFEKKHPELYQMMVEIFNKKDPDRPSNKIA